MSSKVTAEFKEKFLKTKVLYDTICQAIKIAKLNDVDEKATQELINSKQRLKQECADNNKLLLRAMNLNNNLVQLGDSWYGIRYYNEKGDTMLKVDILNDKDLPILQRDSRKERDLSRMDLDSLLPGCINDLKLDLYKQRIYDDAIIMVNEISGVDYAVPSVEPSETEVNDELTVSLHAGARYVQRKLNIGINNLPMAKSYYKEHIKEIQPQIIKGYESASLLWTGEDGITYSFDDNNLIYVVGNRNIITLYEADYGFSKDINRSIVQQQVEVLKASYQHMKEVVNESERNNALDSEEMNRIADTIRVLNARIDELKAEQDILRSEGVKALAQARTAKERFNQEFNKLFKKWDD